MASATVDSKLIEEVSEMTKSLLLSNGILNTSNSDLIETLTKLLKLYYFNYYDKT